MVCSIHCSNLTSIQEENCLHDCSEATESAIRFAHLLASWALFSLFEYFCAFIAQKDPFRAPIHLLDYRHFYLNIFAEFQHCYFAITLGSKVRNY